MAPANTICDKIRELSRESNWDKRYNPILDSQGKMYKKLKKNLITSAYFIWQL